MSDAKDHLAELEERIAKIREQYDGECAEYSDLFEKATEAKRKRDATWRYLQDTIEYKNKVDGELRDCDHDIQTEYSGRGVGFDLKCVKCGWCKNAFPVY